MIAPDESAWGKYSLWVILPFATIRLQGLSASQLASLQNIYTTSISKPHTGQEKYVLTCSTYKLSHPPTVATNDLTQDNLYTPALILHDNGIHVTGINFKAYFSLVSSEKGASLGVHREEELTRLGVIENFLRISSAFHILHQGGLVLHSAGIIFNEKSYIFQGRSNAGKTTLSRKAFKHGAWILSDDINVLQPAENGYVAHAVPFTGEFGRTLSHKGKNKSYPVAAVILLRQGKQLQAEQVTTAEAVATLLTGCPFVNTIQEESEALFDAVINLSSQIPVLRLTSQRDDDIQSIMSAVETTLHSITG